MAGYAFKLVDELSVRGRTFLCDLMVDCVALFMGFDAISICIVFRSTKVSRPANWPTGERAGRLAHEF